MVSIVAERVRYVVGAPILVCGYAHLFQVVLAVEKCRQRELPRILNRVIKLICVGFGVWFLWRIFVLAVVRYVLV